MSVEEVEKSVNLKYTDVFNHSSVIKPEIEKLRDCFERNERNKEFDGLIKKNHRLYEASETNVVAAMEKANLPAVIEKINRITERLEKLSTPHYTKEHFKNVDLLSLTQTEIVKLAEAEVNKPFLNSLEALIEKKD